MPRELRPLKHWRYGPTVGVVSGLGATAAFWGLLGPIAMPLAFGLLACGIITVPFALQGGLHADREGLVVRSLMAARRLPWDRIVAVHWHERRQAVCLHLLPPEPAPGEVPDPLVPAAEVRVPPLQFFNWYGLSDAALIAWLEPPGGLSREGPSPDGEC